MRYNRLLDYFYVDGLGRIWIPPGPSFNACPPNCELRPIRGMGYLLAVVQGVYAIGTVLCDGIDGRPESAREWCKETGYQMQER